MNDNKREAYFKAREAAALDFESALSGLLAAHGELINKLEEQASSARFAMTCAIAISGRGIQGDTRRVMVDRIISEIGSASCAAERDFIKNNQAQDQTNDR